MASIYGKPKTLSDFKKLKSSYRQGKNPIELFELHNRRNNEKVFINPLSLIQFIKHNYNFKYCLSSSNIQLIPIGTSSPSYLEKIYCPRKKNYNAPRPCFKQSNLQENNMGRYSSRCTYTRYTYSPMIQSFGYLINPTTMYIRIDSNKGLISKIIKAPRGFHYEIDNNGLKIQSNSVKSMDYHFTAIDLTTKTMKEIIQICKDNYNQRKKNKLTSDLFSNDDKKINKVLNLANKLEVQVSIVDSIKAGNCLAGTESWMRRNHLEKKHYPVFVISSRMNTDNERVKLAILRAIERTKKENKRGYSLLEDHYLDYQTN